ncbi:and tpr domain protein [Moniliophthora roreri MCA 2997]|uniref:And tpr domain protein n=2 Tax=Moniliophthora roreri TaxID=221103 RepID=V2WWS1_MONRO|nr:and tpr domain protein [Moniliophthora roreri MCA 2997]KAI3601686.1 TPR repeat motif-containing protein [Moniliophthora roreri]
MRFLALSSFILSLAVPYIVADQGGLYPPGLLPLINRANALLSAGQFNEAANVYSEAIEQSPTDYLLYYKRATAYLSLSRHSSALDDFDKVLSLTSNTFDNAYLMKARIHLKEGEFKLAREDISAYMKSNKSPDASALELRDKIEEADKLMVKAQKEYKSQLSNACVETTSTLLREYTAYSIPIRSLRAECSLLSGDVAGAVGDYTRLAALLPAEEAMRLQQRVFRLSYFFLPAPEDSASGAALNPLKQCLHFDPDNKDCLSLHRQAKSFERSFAKLQDLLGKEDWRAVVGILTESGKGKEKDLLRKFDELMAQNTLRDQLLPPSSARGPEIPLPDPNISSPRRQTLIRALCRAYTNLASASSGSAYLRKSEMYCGELLGMEGCAEDVDGLVGKASVLLQKDEDEDLDEAVRLLERAFEASGRSNRDIHRRLSEAKKQIKMRRRKDYYKVLDVGRDADEKTIKKAYRKAAKTAHPDKGGSEAKMAAVNEAYEVLSNPELRARFDAGDDPNDPMSGQGGPYAYHAGGGFPGGFPGGDHPFAQFFQQSAGGHHGFPGGQQFKFHFG